MGGRAEATRRARRAEDGRRAARRWGEQLLSELAGALGERLRGHLPRACRRGGAGSLLRDHLDRLLMATAAAGRDGWPGGERRGQAMQDEANEPHPVRSF